MRKQDKLVGEKKRISTKTEGCEYILRCSHRKHIHLCKFRRPMDTVGAQNAHPRNGCELDKFGSRTNKFTAAVSWYQEANIGSIGLWYMNVRG